MIMIEAGGHCDRIIKAGKTPLIVAYKHGCLSEVQYLCDTGAQVNCSDHVGKTGLHYLKKHLTAGRRPGCHSDYREQRAWSNVAALESCHNSGETGLTGAWTSFASVRSPDVTTT